MKKHIIASLCLIATCVLLWYVASIDKATGALLRIENIIAKSKIEIKKEKKVDETDEKIKALEERAGNVKGFEVSKLYKAKCSSCHGINGEGGVGSKIIGLSFEEIKSSLEKFKSGEKKNYVMYGLLQNLKPEEIQDLSKEIATFLDKEQ